MVVPVRWNILKNPPKMRPFLTSFGITVGHFLLLSLAWSVTSPLSGKVLVFILGIYLAIGPLPYLWLAFNQNKGLEHRRQFLVYLLGACILLITLVFVRLCQEEYKLPEALGAGLRPSHHRTTSGWPCLGLPWGGNQIGVGTFSWVFFPM